MAKRLRPAPDLEMVIDSLLQDFYDASPIGTALVLGYRPSLVRLLKAFALALGDRSFSTASDEPPAAAALDPAGEKVTK